MPDTVLPPKLDLGTLNKCSIYSVIMAKEDYFNPDNRPTLLDYIIPPFQRPEAWETERKVKFIESLFLGLDLGTITVNENPEHPSCDGILLDGQQRLSAIRDYMEGKFPVFDHYYSELTPSDLRGRFRGATMGIYLSRYDNEHDMREHYDRMNFGGISHTEDQRALPTP